MTTKGRKKRAPTMNDVAEVAGVSQTTVSFVLNNNPNASIPEETRERVMAAVNQLGYRPNAMAQSLRMQRSNSIGFITDEIAITPFAGKIIEGAQDAAWDNGKILLLVNTKGDPGMERAATEMLLERQVEAIIYATMYHHAVTVPAALRGIPTVLLDCYLEDRSLPSVVPDEEDGGYQATITLLDKGHRRVGFINNRDPIPATVGRLRGYKRALKKKSIPFDKSLVWSGVSDSDGGYQGALELMRRPNPPTALFCYNDRMAMGAYEALRGLGLRIPQDVAVMGFDNQEIIAAHLFPPLSTVELPHYKMGVWAVNYLVQDGTVGDSANPVQRKLECSLIERSST